MPSILSCPEVGFGEMEYSSISSSFVNSSLVNVQFGKERTVVNDCSILINAVDIEPPFFIELE